MENLEKKYWLAVQALEEISGREKVEGIETARATAIIALDRIGADTEQAECFIVPGMTMYSKVVMPKDRDGIACIIGRIENRTVTQMEFDALKEAIDVAADKLAETMK